MERWQVIYSGRVQGVGFRATCRQIAEGFDVTGWVRNEPDGSVRLEAQGDPDELRRFTARIREVLVRYIHTHDVTPVPETDAEKAFEIRR